MLFIEYAGTVHSTQRKTRNKLLLYHITLFSIMCARQSGPQGPANHLSRWLGSSAANACFLFISCDCLFLNSFVMPDRLLRMPVGSGSSCKAAQGSIRSHRISERDAISSTSDGYSSKGGAVGGGCSGWGQYYVIKQPII